MIKITFTLRDCDFTPEYVVQKGNDLQAEDEDLVKRTICMVLYLSNAESIEMTKQDADLWTVTMQIVKEQRELVENYCRLRDLPAPK